MKSAALILGSLLLAGDALGCSITVRKPLKFAFQDARYFFIGQVKAAGRSSVTLEVTEQFSGELVSEVTLHAASNCEMSPSEFVPNVPYLVDVTEETDGRLVADYGGYTHALVRPDDRELRLVRQRGRWWKSRLSRISFYRFRHWLGGFSG